MEQAAGMAEIIDKEQKKNINLQDKIQQLTDNLAEVNQYKQKFGEAADEATILKNDLNTLNQTITEKNREIDETKQAFQSYKNQQEKEIQNIHELNHKKQNQLQEQYTKIAEITEKDQQQNRSLQDKIEQLADNLAEATQYKQKYSEAMMKQQCLRMRLQKR